MPRPQRSTPGGYCYHVLNRGNARQQVFHKPADYAAFVRLFDEAPPRFAELERTKVSKLEHPNLDLRLGNRLTANLFASSANLG